MCSFKNDLVKHSRDLHSALDSEQRELYLRKESIKYLSREMTNKACTQLSNVRVRKFGWSAAGAGGFVGCARLRRGVFAPRSRREHAPSARIPSNFEGENGMNLDWPRAREGARAELVLSGGSICERAQKSAHTNRHESPRFDHTHVVRGIWQ